MTWGSLASLRSVVNIATSVTGGGYLGAKLNHAAPVPDSYFGMTHLGVADTPVPAVQFSFQRIWDSYIQSPTTLLYKGASWADSHTAAGTFEWSYFDGIMALVAARGKAPIIYTFGYKPSWVTEGANFNTQFAAFVDAILVRAAGRIKVWGLWNEPNTTGGPNERDAASLYAMAQIAYPKIKAAVPGAVILSPEYQGNGVGELTSFLALGGGNYFDVLGLHLYTQSDPDALASAGGTQAIITGHKAALATYGLSSKAIWNTEFSEHGYSSFGGTSAENERDYLSQNLPLHWASGIDRDGWYASDSDTTGRLQTGSTKNVAGAAWDVVRGWMVGKVLGAPVTSGKTIYIPVTGQNGYVGRIVWNYKADATYTVAAGAFTRLTMADGNQYAIGGTETIIPIGNTAVLIDNASPGVSPSLYGANLITNPDFAGNVTTGWVSSGTAVLSAVGDVGRVTNSADYSSDARTNFATDTGARYLMTLDIHTGNQDAELAFSENGDDYGRPYAAVLSNNALTRVSVVVKATFTASQITVRPYAENAAQIVQFDNVEVRKIA